MSSPRPQPPAGRCWTPQIAAALKISIRGARKLCGVELTAERVTVSGQQQWEASADDVAALAARRAADAAVRVARAAAPARRRGGVDGPGGETLAPRGAGAAVAAAGAGPRGVGAILRSDAGALAATPDPRGATGGDLPDWASAQPGPHVLDPCAMAIEDPELRATMWQLGGHIAQLGPRSQRSLLPAMQVITHAVATLGILEAQGLPSRDSARVIGLIRETLAGM